VMNEYKISSADISIRCDATIDDLIDVLEAKSRSYIPVIYALNKIDAISIQELDLLYRIPDACPISSEHGWNIDELLEMMWEKLKLRRIYTKPKGRAPDYTAPVVLRSYACTVENFVSPILVISLLEDHTNINSVTLFTAQSRTISSTPLCMVVR
jgi:ribosome-interacting GTPase 1